MGFCGFFNDLLLLLKEFISFYMLLDRKNPLTAKSRETCRNYYPDDKLNWDLQISKLCSKLSSVCGVLISKVRHYLDRISHAHI